MSRFITMLGDVEITRAKDVKKHGDHDQTDHGAWATEGSAKEKEIHERITDVKTSNYERDKYDEEDKNLYQKIEAKYKTKDNKTYLLFQENIKTPDGNNIIEVKAYEPKTLASGKEGRKQIGSLGTEGRDSSTIDGVYVDEEYQRQGIATAMLNMARTYAPDNMKISHSFSLTEDAKGWSSVVKHGEHDQSSHGSWAQGVQVAPEVVRSTLERVKENGGLSVSLKDGSEPSKGFMVAKGKKFAAIVKADEFFDEAKGAEILSSYMKQHKSEFNNSNNYLGLWHNTQDNQVYLDVSENIEDEGEAISRGRERDQISIWDVANFKEIETGGTGGIEKTRGSQTARFVEHDRRADRQLRQRDLGEVSKRQERVKVIYFDYGLKPVFKHEGHEDQSSHGNWARGFTEEEVKRIESMATVGPSDKEILQAIKPKTYSDNQLSEYVQQDGDLYADATQGIDDKVAESLASLQAEFPNREYTEQEKYDIFDRVQNEMISNYVDGQRESLTEYAMAVEGYEPVSTDDLVGPFNDVFGVVQTGTSLTGDTVTLESRIENVYKDGNDLRVQGSIYNQDGEQVGEISRTFFEKNGTLNVEHGLLWIYEEANKGTGFGKEFIKQSEAWYTAQGLGYIEIKSTAQDGARHWARAGYDFAPNKVGENLDTISQRVASMDDEESGWFAKGSPERAEFDSLMSRATNDYSPYFEDESGYKYPAFGSVKNFTDENFPLPAEFANIGYSKEKEEEIGTWAGKELMYDLKVSYVKSLTAEGQKLLEGPIDHDGDGLIYDGTAREKPAPSKKN